MGTQPQSATTDNLEISSPGLKIPASVTLIASDLPAISGTIQDFAPGVVSVSLRLMLPLGALARVQVAEAEFEGEVSLCRPSEDSYEIHISIRDADERGVRRAPRFPVRLAARVFSALSEKPIDATIVDISSNGLGLISSTGLPFGATIAVDSECNTSFGSVRHSREVSTGGFHVGVEVHNVIAKAPTQPEVSRKSGVLQRIGALRLLSGRSPERERI